MFTGLIESLGTLIESQPDLDGIGRRLAVAAPFAAELDLGESVSVNGTCLTVVDCTPERFTVQVSPTTLDLTTMGLLEPGTRVNLERSVTPSTRLGGHWVLGHVDTRGRIDRIHTEGQSHHITIAYPPQYSRWVLPQGSITLDGISLTIVARDDTSVDVTIIPHTWSHTNIQQWRPGSLVNIEFDVLGKYLEHLMAPYRDATQSSNLFEGGMMNAKPTL
ncbi:MAG: riboflavin synthase [Firmicutes bacterium]|nr:riboflavin synthase [Bacillota bacterium]